MKKPKPTGPFPFKESKDGQRGHSLKHSCGFCKGKRFRSQKQRNDHTNHCGK